jgi:hypothetical protein
LRGAAGSGQRINVTRGRGPASDLRFGDP